MYEESKSINSDPRSQKSSALSSTNKPQTRSGGWSLRSFLICCPPDEGTNEQTLMKLHKKFDSATTTYYSGEPGSFIERRNTNNHKSRDTIKASLKISATHVGLYPRNNVFLLGHGRDKIVCKIIKHSISKLPIVTNNSRNSRTYDTQDSIGHKTSISEMEDLSLTTLNALQRGGLNRQEIFSLYEQGIRVDPSDWGEVTPESLAQHVAQKLKGKFVIDALCGHAGNTIQFAKYCSYVMGIEIEPQKMRFAKHNASIYHVENSIDYIHADFFTLHTLKADVVFLAPTEVQPKEGDKLTFEQRFCPNLGDLIRHSLKIAKSLCIQLPPLINPDELASVFCKIFNENPDRYHDYNFSLQIDLLYIDENYNSMIVFFGDDNHVEHEEQCNLVCESLITHGNPSLSIKHSTSYLHRLVEYVGLQRTLTIIANIEENNEPCLRECTLYDMFIEHLLENDLVTDEVLSQLKYAPSLPQSSFGSGGSPTKISRHNSIKIASFGNGPFMSEFNNEPDHAGSLCCTPSQKKSSLELLREDSQYGIGHYRAQSNIPESYLTGYSMCDHVKNSMRPAGSFPCHHNDGTPVAGSPDNVSELAVSSYSLKSNAMMDSFSDNGGCEYQLSFDDEEEGSKKKFVEDDSTFRYSQSKMPKVPAPGRRSDVPNSKHERHSLVESGDAPKKSKHTTYQPSQWKNGDMGKKLLKRADYSADNLTSDENDFQPRIKPFQHVRFDPQL